MDKIAAMGEAEKMEPPDNPDGPRIKRLIGVYDADGSIRGEVAYWLGARLGRRHCSLCDITHGSMKESRKWRRCRYGLPVPFDTFHRDDQPDDVQEASHGMLPTVIAETDTGLVVLLGPDGLKECEGSPQQLVDALSDSARAGGLTWR